MWMGRWLSLYKIIPSLILTSFIIIMETTTVQQQKQEKTNKTLALLKEISNSPYDQIEIIANVLKEMQKEDRKLFYPDQYLSMFEDTIDEVIERLEDDIVYFDPTPEY